METLDLSTMQKDQTYIKCLIYGVAGCGKTHFLRDWPKPLLLLDFDDKFEPLIGVEGIEVMQYKLTKPEDAGVLIPKLWRDWRNNIHKNDKWKTVAFDSVTALDRMLERYTVIMCGKNKTPTDKATLQEYGDMKRWYRTFFPSLMSADKNIVVLAHEQIKMDKDEILSIRPLITGTMSEELTSIFKHVFHMEHIVGGNERRLLHYQKHKKYLSNSSVFSGGTGSIENPTYEKLIAAIKEQSK